MKQFLTTSKSIERSSYIWNTIGGLVMAFQSVGMLIALSHAVSISYAGIFTIAYANATQMHLIGKWGMRNYQISDINNVFLFKDYLKSRIITSIIMLTTSIIVIAFLSLKNEYTTQKLWILIFICFFKLIDVIEDVYTAHYQKCGRLDIGAKCMSIRLMISFVAFVLLVLLTKDLLVSLIISTIVSAVILLIFLKTTITLFSETIRKKGRTGKNNNVIVLLIACLPLFGGGFLSLYYGNAQKYAIDAVLGDQYQAQYGFISMPVFVIGLLASFIFNPIILKMSELWKSRSISTFINRIKKQLLYILMITAAVVIIGFLIGLPVLSLLFNTDLNRLLLEFIILLISGGILAVASLFVIILTIIRFQTAVIIGFTIAAIAAFILSPIFVTAYGLKGAASLYFMLSIVTVIVLVSFLCYKLKSV